MDCHCHRLYQMGLGFDQWIYPAATFNVVRQHNTPQDSSLLSIYAEETRPVMYCVYCAVCSSAIAETALALAA